MDTSFLRQVCVFFFLQEYSYSAIQSFLHISDFFLKFSNLSLHRVFRNLSNRQLVKNPVNCCLHLSITNSYNPCVICSGCILHSWESYSILQKKNSTKLLWFWSDQCRPDNIDTKSFMKSESMHLSKGKASYKGHDSSVWSTEQGNATLKHC